MTVAHETGGEIADAGGGGRNGPPQTRPVFAVAPMIDWTDRHCRFFHRQLTHRALLFTEMVVDQAVIHGNRERLLGFDRAEHRLALQLGGSDPARLAEAARIGEGFGYDEINLNVGCPSDRVQSGAFGACLMLTPELVGDCVAAMKAAVRVPVTVKCRIAVDEQDPEEALDRLADAVLASGADGLWVHARKAWLKGLSPKENREIPPLDYDRVRRLKARLPHVFVGLNGGLPDVRSAYSACEGLDGAMLGRAAYQNPSDLAAVDGVFHGAAMTPLDRVAVVETMVDYAGRHIARGGRLAQVTRHMIDLFAGLPGARRWRQTLSEGSARPNASPQLLLEALAAVQDTAAAA